MAAWAYWLSALGGVADVFINRATHNKKIGSLIGRVTLILVCVVVAAFIYPYGFNTWANHIFFFNFVIGFFDGYACANIMSVVP